MAVRVEGEDVEGSVRHPMAPAGPCPPNNDSVPFLQTMAMVMHDKEVSDSGAPAR